MKDLRAKVRGHYILHGEAGIVEQRLVRVERKAARVEDDNSLGYGIGYAAKLSLVLKEFLLRSFPILNVGVASKPPDELAFLVELRNEPYEEPAVFAIIFADSSFH